MKSVFGKKLAEILRKRSWQLIRIKESHHQYRKDGITVSIRFHFSVEFIPLSLPREAVPTADSQNYWR